MPDKCFVTQEKEEINNLVDDISMLLIEQKRLTKQTESSLKEISKKINKTLGKHKKSTPINKKDLSTRSFNLLQYWGFNYWEEVADTSDRVFMSYRNLGKVCLEEIRIVQQQKLQEKEPNHAS